MIADVNTAGLSESRTAHRNLRQIPRLLEVSTSNAYQHVDAITATVRFRRSTVGKKLCIGADRLTGTERVSTAVRGKAGPLGSNGLCELFVARIERHPAADTIAADSEPFRLDFWMPGKYRQRHESVDQPRRSGNPPLSCPRSISDVRRTPGVGNKRSHSGSTLGSRYSCFFNCIARSPNHHSKAADVVETMVLTI